MTIVKVLSGHYSSETAYIVDGYPYGFVLKCRKKYWLEVNKKGTRLMEQTTNPKKSGEVWNAVKMSVYSSVGALFINEEGHVAYDCLSMYWPEKARKFLETYKEGLLPEQQEYLVNLADAYDKKEASKSTTIDPQAIV